MEPIKEKFERLRNICTTLEQDKDIRLRESQKDILYSFKNPHILLTSNREEDDPLPGEYKNQKFSLEVLRGIVW